MDGLKKLGQVQAARDGEAKETRAYHPWSPRNKESLLH